MTTGCTMRSSGPSFQREDPKMKVYARSLFFPLRQERAGKPGVSTGN